MSNSTVNYKCQNCGSPLVVEPGQDRAMCRYCRSQNVITVGVDGSITLSLVEKVDAIDSKTDQILASQNAALLQAQQMQQMAMAGHLLTTATNEHQHFLQNEFRPRMVMLEEERDKIGKFNGGCGCGIAAACAFFGFIIMCSGDPIAFLLGIAIAAGGVFIVMSSATKRRKSIQEKMDALTQKRAGYDKQIGDIKKKMSSE